MIKIFRQLLPLFAVQFFTWTGLFSLWIYATPAITRYIFHTTDSESEAFQNGTTWVGICFAFYSLLAALIAFYIPRLEKRMGRQKLHAAALFAGSVGLMLIYIIKEKYTLLISFTFIGIAWSSISSVPYSIISNIASEKKMAVYFAVFNFSVVIPQITAAFLLGYINKHFFSGETIEVILTGGCSMMIGALLMFLLSPLQKQDE